jgi:hypothetical protein
MQDHNAFVARKIPSLQDPIDCLMCKPVVTYNNFHDHNQSLVVAN